MRKPTTEGGPERLVALSDGVFAIAVTLLVLDIDVPPGLNDAGFHEALGDVLSNLGAYALSFAVLAGFWRDHRAIFHRVRLVDADVIWLTVLPGWASPPCCRSPPPWSPSTATSASPSSSTRRRWPPSAPSTSPSPPSSPAAPGSTATPSPCATRTSTPSTRAPRSWCSW